MSIAYIIKYADYSQSDQYYLILFDIIAILKPILSNFVQETVY